MARVVVVTGAGASHDCASGAVEASRPPPLTKDLFSADYRSILNQYPLVRQAAGDIRGALRGTADEPTVALEDFLRERMLASTSPYTQRRYRQVPLYLQEVLSEASRYTAEPDNYNVLVNAALEMDEALFLTLNYDTLLDGRFAEYGRLDDLDWYVDSDRWSLIKLHGSVNWAWRLDLMDIHAELSQGGIDTANQIFDDYVVAGFPEFKPTRLSCETRTISVRGDGIPEIRRGSSIRLWRCPWGQQMNWSARIATSKLPRSHSSGWTVSTCS